MLPLERVSNHISVQGRHLWTLLSGIVTYAPDDNVAIQAVVLPEAVVVEFSPESLNS